MPEWLSTTPLVHRWWLCAFRSTGYKWSKSKGFWSETLFESWIFQSLILGSCGSSTLCLLWHSEAPLRTHFRLKTHTAVKNGEWVCTTQSCFAQSGDLNIFTSSKQRRCYVRVKRGGGLICHITIARSALCYKVMRIAFAFNSSYFGWFSEPNQENLTSLILAPYGW